MSNEMKIDDWLSCIPSKQTRKCYKAGIKKFELYYKQPIESLLNLNDEDLGHIIEKFYAYLTDNNVCQNTKRNVVNCTVQYLKYFGKNPKYRKALGIYKTVESTKDKKLLIGDIQELAKVSDLREQVLLETLLLGLRISDVSVLEWQSFLEDNFIITTRKEQVTAHIFISPEFRDLLNLFLPSLDKSNKYLFQSAKNLHLTTKHIDYTLKHLAKRAGAKDWERYHWHLGRKLVLRTSAELGLSMWSSKMIVGKSIPSSDSTYLQGTDLKEDFIKLSKVLTLKPSNGNGKVTKLEEVINSMEKENSIYKTRVDLLQKNQTEQQKQIEEFTIKEEYHKLETNALKNILTSLMDKEQLEALITAQLNHATTNEILKANPNRNFSMEPPKVEIDLKQYSKDELIKIYFENATNEDSVKESKEREENMRLAHEESVKIREKIKQAKEKAKANVIIYGTHE